MTRRPLFAAALAAALLTALPGPARASSTGLWKQESLLNFYDGNFKDSVITDEGEITLGKTREELLSSPEPYIWDLLDDGNGSLWAGSGNKAILYQIPIKGGPAREWALPGLGVSALARRDDGAVFAAGFPQGDIYKIDPKTNEKSLFVKLPDRFVWDMTFGPGGDLYVVTGLAANLYRVDKEGKSQVVFKSNEKHFLTMAADEDGRIFIGSSPNGYLYMVSPDGSATALNDFEEEEIYRVKLGKNGKIFAAANFVQPSDKTPREPVKRDEPLTFPFVATGKRGANSLPASLYEVDRESRLRRILQTPDPYILSLEWLSPGVLFVGTGNEGHYYTVNVDEDSSSLAQLPCQQILSASADNGALYVGTGNSASVYRIGEGFSKEGTYQSVANDLSFRTQWGKLDSNARTGDGASISFRVRTGNTKEPDETWSAWSEPMETLPAPVTNPPGRFVQYEAMLKTNDPGVAPVMKDFRLSYLSDNQKPRVLSMDVSPQPARFQPPARPESPPGPGNGEAPKQPQTNLMIGAAAYSPTKEITWQAQDEDMDPLEYDLYFRKTPGAKWSLIEEKITGAKYSWSAGEMPDGEYELRLVASDRTTNPPERALEDEKISEPFKVDNSPPRFENVQVQIDKSKQARVTGSVTDGLSNVSFLEYAVDGLEWKVVFPADSIFDSTAEPVDFVTDPLEPEEHTILLRARDALGNVGSYEIGVSVR